MGLKITNSKLEGAGFEQIPSPGENQGKPKSGGSIQGSGKGGAVSKASPFTASYDSRPQPGDMKPGATRSKGAK